MTALLLDGQGLASSVGDHVITNAEAETYLGYTFADQDVLTAWISAAETAIARKCRLYSADGENPFLPVSATEYHDGNGEAELWLRRWPVIDVASVYVDQSGAYGEGANAFAAATALDVGTEYFCPLSSDQFANRGRLQRTDGAKWPLGCGNIKVIYEAGFDPIPEDLKLLVCKVLKSNLSQQAGGIEGCAQSVTHGQFSITFAVRDRHELNSINSLMSLFAAKV